MGGAAGEGGEGAGGGGGPGEAEHLPILTPAEIIAAANARGAPPPGDRLHRALPGLADGRHDETPPPTPPTPPPAPKLPLPSKFFAQPGVAISARVITASRYNTMYGTMGNQLPLLTSASKSIAYTGDTLSTFLPIYQRFMQEFAAINNLKLTDDEFEQARQVVKNNNKALHRGMLNDLERIKPGLSQVIYSVLGPQFSEGEFGTYENMESFADSPLWTRINALGFGTHFQAEILQVLDNAQFFDGSSLTMLDKGFRIDYKNPADPNAPNVVLVTGKVDEKAHSVSFKIDPNAPDELRDLAIKHLVMMTASHTQQNNSNQFDMKFGDNPYENLRILELAIGVYNMRASQKDINAYIAKLPKDVEPQLLYELNFWAQQSEVFAEKMAPDGNKILDKENPNPLMDAKGKKMKLTQVQEMLAGKVKGGTFSKPNPGRRPSSP